MYDISISRYIVCLYSRRVTWYLVFDGLWCSHSGGKFLVLWSSHPLTMRGFWPPPTERISGPAERQISKMKKALCWSRNTFSRRRPKSSHGEGMRGPENQKFPTLTISQPGEGGGRKIMPTKQCWHRRIFWPSDGLVRQNESPLIWVVCIKSINFNCILYVVLSSCLNDIARPSFHKLRPKSIHTSKSIP